MLTIQLVVAAVAGALGAALANRGIAVYADGLRPIMPELIEGRMGRRELATVSFGLGFGLWMAFGIPFSFASAILLVHALWLGTDIVGTWLPGSFGEGQVWERENIIGLVGSLMIGGLYGATLFLGLEASVSLSESLPVDLFGALGAMADPVILTFTAVPPVAVAYQSGFKHGILALLLSLVAWQAAHVLGQPRPDHWAFAFGTVALVAYSVRDRTTEEPLGAQGVLFAERAKRIRRNLPAIALMGATYGVASHLAVLMEGAQSSIALGKGDIASPTAMTVAMTATRAVSLTPLKGMTSLSTGVFATDGLGFVATAGLMSPNAVVAVILGAVVMSLEALSLVAVAQFLDRYPGIRRSADSMRTAMTKLLEVATLVGGLMAANAMVPGMGMFAVAGLYVLNETARTPVIRVAIGPAGAILVGIVANTLALLGLYSPLAQGVGF